MQSSSCVPRARHNTHSATPILSIETIQWTSSSGHIDTMKLWHLCYISARFMQLFLPLVVQKVLSLTGTSIRTVMLFRFFIIFFADFLFAVLRDYTDLHPQLQIFAHPAYYFCTFLLMRVFSIAIITIIIFQERTLGLTVKQLWLRPPLTS